MFEFIEKEYNKGAVITCTSRNDLSCDEQVALQMLGSHTYTLVRVLPKLSYQK